METITKRSDGRYMGRFIIGYENAKAVYQYVYGSTYNEAVKKLRLGKEIESKFISGRNVSVKEVYDEWLTSAANHVKESTCANYRTKFELHILPEFGESSCCDLTASMINSFISKKLNAGLSASYVRDIITIFKTMLRYAQEEYDFHLSLKNVVVPKCTKKQVEKISDVEQSKLVAYLKENMDLTAFGMLISLFMGLRIGEICGLKWSDIDFENKVLYVRRTVQRISCYHGDKKTKVMISTPKSASSFRSIPIPDCIMEYFENLRDNDECYIVSGSESVVEPRTFQNRYKKIMKSAEVKEHNFHQLRHTFATNCMQVGIDICTLSQLLGHQNTKVTLDRYIHPDHAHKRLMMNKLCIRF